MYYLLYTHLWFIYELYLQTQTRCSGLQQCLIDFHSDATGVMAHGAVPHFIGTESSWRLPGRSYSYENAQLDQTGFFFLSFMWIACHFALWSNCCGSWAQHMWMTTVSCSPLHLLIIKATKRLPPARWVDRFHFRICIYTHTYI